MNALNNQSVSWVEVGVLDYIIAKHMVRDLVPENTGRCSAGDGLHEVDG